MDYEIFFITYWFVFVFQNKINTARHLCSKRTNQIFWKQVEFHVTLPRETFGCFLFFIFKSFRTIRRTFFNKLSKYIELFRISEALVACGERLAAGLEGRSQAHAQWHGGKPFLFWKWPRDL